MLGGFLVPVPADTAAGIRHDAVRAEPVAECQVDRRHRDDVIDVEREDLIFKDEHAVTGAAEPLCADREKEASLAKLDAAAVHGPGRLPEDRLEALRGGEYRE